MSECAPVLTPAALRRDITPRPASIALAAGISVLLHLAAMAALAPQEPARLAGGGEAAPAALGTSFADFAQDMLVPEQPATVIPHSPAPQPAQAPPPTAQPAAAPSLAPAQDPVAVTPAPAGATVPGHADGRAEAAPLPEVALAAPSEVVTPDTRPTELAPEQSRRPAPRPEQPAPGPQQPQPQRAPQGNAPQAAQRGSPEDAQGQAASAAPSRPQTEAAGNAAASNYPGEVLRRIQRVRQARSPARGRVLVSFSISSSGGLSAVSVARSSGNAALDRVALDHIRRAAPFPPPPSGAQRQFSFEFVGR